MFSEKDELQIKNRGSELQTVLNRIENFKKGFPFLQIEPYLCPFYLYD